MLQPPTIRRDLRPGDLGRIVAHHGSVYTPEYGVDVAFEGDLAASVAAAVQRGWPGPREGVWIVESGGRHVGSLALTDEGDDRGAVRWLVLDPELRGHGLGRRLVAELVGKARREGYALLSLHTFSDLRAAAHLYRSHGFELRWEQTEPRWGRDDLTYQRYELSFQACAQDLSSPSAGSSVRPFSVSA